MPAYIDRYGAPEDIENRVPSPFQSPHDPQVELHPQLIGSIVGVFGLVVEVFAGTQSL